MSEETNVQDHNDGTWSGLKKTIVGTASTVVLGAGTWITTTLFGGHSDDKEETKTEQVAPAAAPVINLNLQNNNTQTQAAGGGTKVIERVVEKPAAPAPTPKPKEFTEEPKW